MKRNMDLCRDILFKVEAGDGPLVKVSHDDFENVSQDLFLNMCGCWERPNCLMFLPCPWERVSPCD